MTGQFRRILMLNIKYKLLAATIMTLGITSANAEMMTINYASPVGQTGTFNAEVNVPLQPAQKSKAVVLLHHAGGYQMGTTAIYRELFLKNGYVTVEPVMFDRMPRQLRSDYYIPYAFASLKYLAERADVDANDISVVGMSFGGSIAVYSATKWVNDTYNNSGTSFKKYASLYPVCWPMEQFIRGTLSDKFKQLMSAYPADMLNTWQNSPMKLYKGSNDDYDSQDSKVCDNFVDAIPSKEQREQTKVELINGATHGWDHGKTYSFYTSLANHGSGGTNINESNTDVTEFVKQDLVKFISE